MAPIRSTLLAGLALTMPIDGRSAVGREDPAPHAGASARLAIVPTGPVAATTTADAAKGPASFARANDGLFYVTGMVNGAPVQFLIDTGASVVVLTRDDAARAGIATDRFASSVQTANGSSPMAWTKLRHVKVAGVEVSGIDAAIPQAGLKVSLLGQNMLARMGTMTLTRDHIVVHGPQATSQ